MYFRPILSVITFFILYGLIGRSYSEECGWMCPQNYNPVCGERTEKGKFVQKMFGNECELNAANDCKEGWGPCSLLDEIASEPYVQRPTA